MSSKVTSVEVEITREVPLGEDYRHTRATAWEALAEFLGITQEEATARFQWCMGSSAPTEDPRVRRFTDTYRTKAPVEPQKPREELPPWRGDREYLQLQHERAWTPERYGGGKG
jgi:hypothetical protein